MTRPAGRRAVLPTAGYQAPRRVFITDTTCTVLVIAECDDRRKEYDFTTLPVARELRDWLARAFAGITGPSGRRRTVSSAESAIRALRMLTGYLATLEQPPARPEHLRPAHLDGLILSRGDDPSLRRQLYTLRAIMRCAQDVPEEFFARLNRARVECVDGKVPSYTEPEFRRISAAARAHLRAMAARIGAGRELLARWRAGQIDRAIDRDAWDVGWLLNHIDRHDDVPRYASAHRSNVHNKVSEHGGSAALFAQLYPTYSDIGAAAVLLLCLTGHNHGSLAGMSATHHRPDGDAGSIRTALVDMVKPRRGRRAHMDVALTEVPAEEINASSEPARRVDLRSPFEVYELLLDLAGPAREHASTDKLFVYYCHKGHCGRGFRTGLPKGVIPDWGAAADLLGDSVDEDGDPLPLRVDGNRIRMSWLELHQQPVAHTERTLANDYLARNRGNLTEYQKIVATTLDEQVTAARSAALMRTLTAEQVELARTHPDTVAAQHGLDTAVLRQLLAGQLDTVLGGCTDNTHGPDTPAGQPCRASFLLCLSCPNARATPAHLPLLVGVHDALTARAPAMTPLRWAQRFAAPVAQLAELLARFPAAAVNAAREDITTEQHARIDRFLNRGLDLL